MNSAKQVDLMVQAWIDQQLTPAQIVVNTAEAELGWDYVWGAVGQECNPSKRRTCIGRCSANEAAVARKKCQVLREKNPKSSCDGCSWYPGKQRTLIHDCQGFVKEVCGRVGIKFTGGGCTSMWKASGNWEAKGDIKTLPQDRVSCVFWTDSDDPKKKSHIGFYIGDGMMIHCSGSVKKEPLSKRCTDWGIPKGLTGEIPVPVLPTLRRGSEGTYVTLCQTKLVQLSYDLSPYGADGKFGKKTEAAVKAFQEYSGLAVTGIVEETTWEALNSAEIKLYTVTIQHLGKKVADEIVKKYGGTMTIEERG